MNNIARLAVGALGALIILMPWQASAQACLPSVAQTLGIDPHHTSVAGGPGKGGTQLASHDTIVIQAPIPGDPSPPPCRSVTNNSSVSYFVPWNSPPEWQDFLNAVGSGHLPGVSIGKCCAPDASETICGVPVGTMNGTANNNLGARWLGLPASVGPDVAYYGGANDVVGPIYACNALGAGVNYAVTFVCQNGGWVQTHSVGSCTPLDGVCGAIPAGGFVTLPSDLTTLCGAGSVEENLTGTGPWSWDCYGTLGTAHCTAPLYTLVNGACGPANGASLASAPSTGLCTAGITGSVVPDATVSNWNWVCAGIDGGTNAYCSASNSNPAGTCGSASGTTVFTAPSLPADLCAPGDIATAVTISGGQWTWSCVGPGGGPLALCSANNGNPAGLCGSDNGLTLSSPPTNLCASGTPSTVTDNGGIYWDWWCTQTGGAANAHCIAYNAGAPVCGPANGTSLSVAPAGSQLCSNGTAGAFTATPAAWQWQCANAAGIAVNCYATNLLAPVDGACGGAAGVPVLAAPTGGLCSSGTASAISGSGPWGWTCSGANGGANDTCSAPLLASVDGVCGTSNGTAIPNTPNINLCAGGTASAVAGSGPWSWTCIGVGTGTTASCSASLCNACGGTITRPMSFARSGTSGSCQMSGSAGWNETDALITSNVGLGSLTIQWTDAFGNFSAGISEGAAPWPQFCSPCYLKYVGSANVGTQINTDNGSCPPGENAGSFVPGSGVTVH